MKATVSKKMEARVNWTASARRIALPATILFVAACLAIAGCGKKEWPSPRTEADRFAWQQVSAQREGTCLLIRGELEGAWQNLKRVVLQLETSDELCPGCPFSPDRSASYPLDDTSLRREGSRVAITHCGIEPETAVRLRLAGENVYSQIPEELSGIAELESENATSAPPEEPGSSNTGAP